MSHSLRIPDFALVALIGASGAGKTTFAARHFSPTQVLSSDHLRAMVSDDENDQQATRDAFDLLHDIAARRLRRRLLTVVDATNVEADARSPLLALAKRHHALPVAIVLNVSAKVCKARNASRTDRDFGDAVVDRHIKQLRKSIGRLAKEGFKIVHVLDDADAVDEAVVDLEPLFCDRRLEAGPFDIVGDVHGCLDELLELLGKLGYSVATEVAEDGGRRFRVTPPGSRRLIFVGDLVDRGPDSPGALRLAMDMVEDGVAFLAPGNHDNKLARCLAGRKVKIAHGLDLTLEQFEKEPASFKNRVREFINRLPSHLVLDGGRLVVAHAGLKESLHNRKSGRVTAFCLYGDTSGQTDNFGLPVRRDWGAEYGGDAMVVYGHTPQRELVWKNNTLCIDTGCVFGGKLTALRYPERDVVSVPAREVYTEPSRPF